MENYSRQGRFAILFIDLWSQAISGNTILGFTWNSFNNYWSRSIFLLNTPEGGNMSRVSGVKCFIPPVHYPSRFKSRQLRDLRGGPFVHLVPRWCCSDELAFPNSSYDSNRTFHSRSETPIVVAKGDSYASHLFPPFLTVQEKYSCLTDGQIRTGWFGAYSSRSIIRLKPILWLRD